MSNLFDNFDLSVDNKKTEETMLSTSKKTEKLPESKLTNQSLFADLGLTEFDIELNKPSVGALLNKLSKNDTDTKETDPSKILKSKKVSLFEKLQIIKTKVLIIVNY